MEECIDEAKRRWGIMVGVYAAAVILLLGAGIGVMCCGGEFFNHEEIGVGILLLLLGAALFAAAGIAAKSAAAGRECGADCETARGMISRGDERWQDMGEALVGERMAYLKSSRQFIIYENVKWAADGYFGMRSGTEFRVNLPQQELGAICARIKAVRKDVLFGEKNKEEWKKYVKALKKGYSDEEPDIVYVDDEDGEWI